MFLCDSLSKLIQAVVLSTCAGEVSISNFMWDTYHDIMIEVL